MSKARDLADLAKNANDRLDDVATSDGALSHRNLVINGDMRIAQRGTSSTSTAYRTVDRWRSTWHASQTITQSQETLSSGDPYDEGFRKFLRMTQGAANSAATDYLQISQRIEGLTVASSGWQFKSSSSYITASFWARSSLAGEYQIYAQTRASTDKYYFKKFNLVANTWTKITCSIAGDSALNIDFDNTSGFEFRIIPYYGTDYTGDRSADEGTWTNYNANELDDFPQDWTASSGATFDVTGVQLEVGDTATPFEHRSYGDELARCQRYYNEFGGVSYSGIVSGMQQSTTISSGALVFPTMRAAPAIGFVDLIATDRTVFDENATQSGSIAATKNAYIRFTHGARGSARDAILLAVKNGTSGKLTLDAEL